jgi:hypothetical protein
MIFVVFTPFSLFKIIDAQMESMPNPLSTNSGYTRIDNKQLGMSVYYPLDWKTITDSQSIKIFPDGYENTVSIEFRMINPNVNQPIINIINKFISTLQEPNPYGINTQIGELKQLQSDHIELYTLQTLMSLPKASDQLRIDYHFALAKNNALYGTKIMAPLSFWSNFLPIFNTISSNTIVGQLTTNDNMSDEEFQSILNEYEFERWQNDMMYCASMNVITPGSCIMK